MNGKKFYKLVLAALLAALCCVATMVIQIPTANNGYLNLGDCIVLLGAWLLGPLYGFFAAGIGSGLADIFSGYAYYAPGTFLIKGLTALAAALLPRLAGSGASPRKRAVFRLLGGLVGEGIMVLGYFGYASLILGKGLPAAAEIPGNLLQGSVGLIASELLIRLLQKAGMEEKLGRAN